MNIRKSKIALALGGLLFLAPFTSAIAHEKHCDDNEQTQLGGAMKEMKSELRGYVSAFKEDDGQKMQAHLDALLKLSASSAEQMPMKVQGMHTDAKASQTMNMPEMDHSKMDMPAMDHSKMDMPEMDHSKMDMSAMANMEGMNSAQHEMQMHYMQGMNALQDLFKSLHKTQDKDEVKAILGQIKTHVRKSHQSFRQDCD